MELIGNKKYFIMDKSNMVVFEVPFEKWLEFEILSLEESHKYQGLSHHKQVFGPASILECESFIDANSPSYSREDYTFDLREAYEEARESEYLDQLEKDGEDFLSGY